MSSGRWPVSDNSCHINSQQAPGFQSSQSAVISEWVYLDSTINVMTEVYALGGLVGFEPIPSRCSILVFVLIEIQLIYNSLLVSGVQQLFDICIY